MVIRRAIRYVGKTAIVSTHLTLIAVTMLVLSNIDDIQYHVVIGYNIDIGDVLVSLVSIFGLCATALFFVFFVLVVIDEILH